MASAGREQTPTWPRVLDNPKACGAPKKSRWGYLPCGCTHNGYGGHMYNRVPTADANSSTSEVAR